ncbi:MAG: hypothetical protein M3R38_34485 [Actinomycetota bacterium]|nr:hypothetical protein [Actinomycetota bacterium]
MNEYEAVLQNQPVDVSGEFADQRNHFFVGTSVPEFDPRCASGKILWKILALKQRVSYHQLTLQFEDYRVWEDVPPGEYEEDQALPFSISFVNPRTLRLRLAARPDPVYEAQFSGPCHEPQGNARGPLGRTAGRPRSRKLDAYLLAGANSYSVFDPSEAFGQPKTGGAVGRCYKDE